MAEIAPFCGIRYNPQKVELSEVLAPPYDVISPSERAQLAKDPSNCVHLILPEERQRLNKYEAAAETLQAWQQKGILRADQEPALYRYHQEWRAPSGARVARKGFISGVRLHPFGDGVILPHERTLNGPKVDRWELMRATKCHFSQIFALFSDPAGEVERAFAATDALPPDMEGQTADGVTHRLWMVTRVEVIGAVTRALRPKKLYIADGHHRYETMLALSEEYATVEPGPGFGTMFLMSMEDPGLTVLPTHRLIEGAVPLAGDALLASLGEEFTLEADGDWRDVVGMTALFAKRALGPSAPPVLCLLDATQSTAWWLTPKPGINFEQRTGRHASLAALPVTWLHGLVLEKRLGISEAAQAQGDRLHYVKDTAQAIAAVVSGKTALAFLVPPASVAQVRYVADTGNFMPQKSTFFYPKIASGLVMRRFAGE